MRLSVINEMLAEVPVDWQIEALQAIASEYDRWRRGDYTEEEKYYLDMSEKLGQQSMETLDNIFLSVVQKHDD